MQAYVPSVGRGRNILKEFGIQQLGSLDKYITAIIRTDKNTNEETVVNEFDYETFYNDLASKEMIFNIEETNGEVGFRFKDKDIDTIMTVLHPKTTGASTPPFSPKNLKKVKKYPFSPTEIAEYKEIINAIPPEDKLAVGRYNNSFLNDFMCKKLRLNRQNVVKEIKFYGLKNNEYFHRKGYWAEYLNYLRKEIAKDYGDN